MYTLQQQYNLLPGQYAEEMATLSVFPHLKSMTMEVAACLSKAVSAARGANRNQEAPRKF